MVQAAPCLTVVADPIELGRCMDRAHLLGGSTSPPKARHQFCFMSPATLDDFVNDLRRLSFRSLGVQLSVFQSAEYITQVRDMVDDPGTGHASRALIVAPVVVVA